MLNPIASGQASTTVTNMDTDLAPVIPGPQIPDLVARTYNAAEDSGISESAWGQFLGVIAPLAEHNAETYAHSLRVGLYAWGLARLEGLNSRLALHGGCAHDMGKCLVPNSVLRTHSFTDSDRILLRNHPSDGQRLLAPTNLFSSFVAGLHHQFQPDPYGVDLNNVALFELPDNVRSEIYTISELVATCDFYDALTTRDNTRSFVSDPTDPAQLVAAIDDYFPTQGRAQWLVDNDLVGTFSAA
jgi:hypothetical protein